MSAGRRLCWALVCCWALVLPSAEAAEWIDLSYVFDNSTQYWPGFLHFNLTEVFVGQMENFWLETHDFEASEHGGTHMDAPAHIGRGGWTVDEIPVERFVAHAALVNIVDRSQADPDTSLTTADLSQWKAEHGPWKYPTIVLVYTGNSRHWTNSNRYWGMEPNSNALGNETELQLPTFHFPGISPEAAQVLADDPAVVGVGLDTPSLDVGTSKTLPAHKILFAKNKFGLEHVGDMSRVPATGATILTLPMKIGGGSGGPCRVLVRLP